MWDFHKVLVRLKPTNGQESTPKTVKYFVNVTPLYISPPYLYVCCYSDAIQFSCKVNLDSYPWELFFVFFPEGRLCSPDGQGAGRVRWKGAEYKFTLYLPKVLFIGL